jgi:hypothetical protein
VADERLDDLYREHPEGFVAARDRLAKDLRAAGDRGEAERVKKLRRPTAAAWLINRAALDSPAELKGFAEASGQLEEAQRRALEGEDEGAADLRAAAAREREAADAVVDTAASAARDAGHPPSQQALDQVRETLRAATGDPELRERVLAGRVEREQSGATLGGLGAVAPKKRGSGSAKRRDTAQAQRELERAERELAEATAREERQRARMEEAEEALRDEKARLAERKRETADLRRQAKAAERKTQG